VRRAADALRWLRQQWSQRWLLRWLAANMAGWSAGLLLVALLMQLLGLAGLAAGGLAAGAVVGAAQALALHTHPAGRSLVPARWVAWSAAGGALATLPVALTGLVALLLPGPGLLLMGLLYGGCLGWSQGRLLRPQFARAAGWTLAGLAGGALCAPLTLLAPLGLPVFCSPGIVIFAFITGLSFVKIAVRDNDIKKD
jgi:hypothetical protein